LASGGFDMLMTALKKTV